MQTKVTTFRNRKASYDYELLERFVAGLVLKGTEVKSIRLGKVNLQASFCLFIGDELWLRSLQIAPYPFASYGNHEAKSDRKLLLKRRELRRLQKKLTEKGLALIPTKIFQSQKGYFKIEIALARGKKLYDKRNAIKERELKRQIKEI